MDTRKVLVVTALTVVLAGCGSAPVKPEQEHALATRCDQAINVGYKELDFSNANGFGGSWEYAKAASLLSAAKVQSSFGGYSGCIEKVKTARAYIKASKQ